jgi:hypothetical protein
MVYAFHVCSIVYVMLFIRESSFIVFTKKKIIYAFQIYIYSVEKPNKLILYNFFTFIFHFVLHFSRLTL